MAIATISSCAMTHNLARVRELAPKARVLAMLKGDAYGHGLLVAAKALAAADGYGVARLSEACALRESGCNKPIVIMGGVTSLAELQLAAQLNLAVVVHQDQHLDWLEMLSAASTMRVWLKIDTGMHRLGFALAQAERAYTRLMANPRVCKPIVVATHFACADADDTAVTLQQLSAFQELTATWPVERSMANSAAIFKYPETHGDWVRPGIMLYGVSPFANATGKDYKLQPALNLTAKIVATRELHQGDCIGYGGTYRCESATRVAAVAMGYGDGYPRHAGPGTKVLLNGNECKLVGRVSMDILSIDIGQHQAAIGDEVVLWGSSLPIEEVAATSGTIAYELTTKLTTRVQRIYLS